MRRSLQAWWLGRRPYAPAYALMQRWHEMRRADAIGDSVLLLEHEPVITLGRAARPQHQLVTDQALAERGIERFVSDRGGDITLHAPGQLVMYPIIDLAPDRRDVRRWVNGLVDVMRRVVARYGVDAGPVPGLVGLWADRRSPRSWPGPDQACELAKLGAVGVRISRWVTLHGCALNLTVDLGLFGLIVPCGIQAHGVTSVAELVGARPPVQDAAQWALAGLAELLGADAAPLRDASRAEIDGLLP